MRTRIFRSARCLGGACALLVAWVPGVLAGEPSKTAASFRERAVLRIPVGPLVGEISNRECSRGEGCVAGHAFPIAFRRTIGFGFLDHGNQDLKLIEIVASRGRVVGVLPAPRLHDTEFVVGGQMDRQGALRLSIGRPSGGSRAATWQPLARKWKTAAEAPPPSHGAHLRLPASDGDSVQAAQANLDRGLLVGCDPAGTCFYDRQRSWSVRTLDAYDGDRPLASVELPERPVWKALAGADLWLSREGEVYEIYVGPRSMHVVSWVLER